MEMTVRGMGYDFDISLENLEMKSVEDRHILLPYNGDISDEVGDYTNAYLLVFMDDIAKVGCMFRIDREDGRSHYIEAQFTNEELNYVLEKFFTGETGLSDECDGFYLAKFHDWVKYVKNNDVVDILYAISKDRWSDVMHDMIDVILKIAKE